MFQDNLKMIKKEDRSAKLYNKAQLNKQINVKTINNFYILFYFSV